MGIFEFTWPHPAGEVLIAGTFNEWRGDIVLCKNESGLFTAVVDLGEAEKVYYKYIVDGRWSVNYDGKREYDHSGNENNVLYAEDLRTPTPSIVERAVSALPCEPIIDDTPETPSQDEPLTFDVNPLPATTTSSTEVAEVPEIVEESQEEETQSVPEYLASTVPEAVEAQNEVEETPDGLDFTVPEAVEAKNEVEEELQAIVSTEPEPFIISTEPEPHQKDEEIPTQVEKTVEPENQPPTTNTNRCVSPTMSPLTTPAAPTTHVYTVGVPGATFNSISKGEPAPSTRSSSASSHESHNEKRELFREKTSEKKKEKRRSVILGRIMNLFK